MPVPRSIREVPS